MMCVKREQDESHIDIDSDACATSMDFHDESFQVRKSTTSKTCSDASHQLDCDIFMIPNTKISHNTCHLVIQCSNTDSQDEIECIDFEENHSNRVPQRNQDDDRADVDIVAKRPKLEDDVAHIQYDATEQSIASVTNESAQDQSNRINIDNDTSNKGIFINDLTRCYVPTQCNEIVGLFIEIISLFGIPFIHAPGEAEAQCVAIQARGDAAYIATDDSDVFGFGGHSILRYFDPTKPDCVAQLYNRDIDYNGRPFSRADAICFAIVFGCDYCDGIKGIRSHKVNQAMAEYAQYNRKSDFVTVDFCHAYVHRITNLLGKTLPLTDIEHVVELFINPRVERNIRRIDWLAIQSEAITYWIQNRGGSWIQLLWKTLINEHNQHASWI